MSRNLRKLLKRLEKANGPSRELDHMIQLYLLNDGKTGAYKSHQEWLDAAMRYGWGSRQFTASVDACLFLAESLLPGKSMTILQAAMDFLYTRGGWHGRDIPQLLPIALLVVIIGTVIS